MTRKSIQSTQVVPIKSKNVLLTQWREESRRIEDIFSEALEAQRYVDDFINNIDEQKLNEPEKFFAFHFIKAQYHFIVLQLCKMIDNDERAVSFRQLLEELKDKSHDFPLDVFDHEKYPWAFGSIKRYLLKCGLNPSSITKDIEKLRKVLEKVKKYRDKHVAHLQRKQVKIVIQKTELGKIINDVEELVATYNLILNQAGINSYLPPQILGWESILNPKKRK